MEPLPQFGMFQKKKRKKAMTCKLCRRAPINREFCVCHLKAYENLVVSFEVWRKASAISWKEYLSQVAVNSSAGEWVKEVAKYLLEKGET